MDLLSQLIRQFSEIGPHTDRGRKPVVSVPLQMVQEILRIEVLFRHAAVFLIKESKVAMDIDHSRHDRLSGEIDMHGARRCLKLAFPADTREVIVLHNECRVFNWCLTVAQDEPGALKNRDLRGPLRMDKRRNDQQEQERDLYFAHISSRR